MARKKPVGWRADSKHHAMAAMGMKPHAGRNKKIRVKTKSFQSRGLIKSARSIPWKKWGLTEEQWNTTDPGGTLGEAIKAASDAWGSQNVTLSDWEDVIWRGKILNLPSVGTPTQDMIDEYGITHAELKAGIRGTVGEIWFDPGTVMEEKPIPGWMRKANRDIREQEKERTKKYLSP